MIVSEDGLQRLGDRSHGVSQRRVSFATLVGEGVVSAQKLSERLLTERLSRLGPNRLDNFLRKLCQFVLALIDW